MKEIYLGVDVGSVSTDIAALDDNCSVLFKQYLRTNGQPLDVVRQGLRTLKEIAGDFVVRGVGVTGSGRQLTGIMVGADIVKNEITAHATATIHYHPDVRTIFEIGGQDSKIILVKDGMVVDFSMNTVCAAGTGSFLDHQAERLGIPIERFGDMALQSDKQVRIAGRCTVFAESDMIAKQQYGFSKAEIIRGLCEALVRNYISNLGRGKRLEPPYVFQGGVAANAGIIRAFEDEIKQGLIIPEYYSMMGAIGSAILALEHVRRTGEPTMFRGLELVDVDFSPSSVECGDCPNCCEVIKVEIGGKTSAMWGDKCGKWSAAV